MIMYDDVKLNLLEYPCISSVEEKNIEKRTNGLFPRIFLCKESIEREVNRIFNIISLRTYHIDLNN